MQFADESQNTAHKSLMLKILDKEVQKVFYTPQKYLQFYQHFTVNIKIPLKNAKLE